MTTADVLRLLYDLEKPLLQRNDWSSLRLEVDQLTKHCLRAFPGKSKRDVERAVRDLRLDGSIMLFPPWEELGETASKGTTQDSSTQWELADFANLEGKVSPTWTRRKVFLPDDLAGWFVRSRTAELTRLLAWNRERFGLAPSSAHLGYELQARSRPQRVPNGISNAVARLVARVNDGSFSRATSGSALAQAIDIVGKGLQRSSGYDTLALFQERGWESVLDSLFNPQAAHRATMVTAGVSSGKTYSFALPILTLIVYRAITGHGGMNRALVIYPRTSLVEDQYHAFSRLIAGVNEELSSRGLTVVTNRPALDAGQMLAASLGVSGAHSLSDVLPQVAARKIEVVLTTPESLKNRMIDSRALRSYLAGVEIVVFDEIHLMEGLSGCQGIYLVRRLRQMIRTLRGEPAFEPAWVGASATVAEPVEHCARALSLRPAQVLHIAPASTELERFGTFHHVFVHTRMGKAAISAVTNGLACTTHNRNNSTAHSHYVDPSAAPQQLRPGFDIPKTIAFVDSLSTIGRLRYTTADNEKTYEPFDPAPPYYTWFFRPAARLRATDVEVKSIEKVAGGGSMEAVRQWCASCSRGQPAVIGKSVLQTPEFRYLRTGISMSAAAIERATPPGLPEQLAKLPEMVGNLDRCPFLTVGLCWWSSQDAGARLPIAGRHLFADQNRAIAYTSKTQDSTSTTLHADVNDYFVVPSEQLWERANVRGMTVSTSTLIASPRIEVGVDFKNVRDGVTHKALRSASSFQQKVGRVGREDGSDSVIVTFLAHRTTDAHFAHHPARLIDALHLDPIPLKADNPDVIKSALFTSVFDFIATRPAGAIPDSGERLNIIGTGGATESSWEAKLLAVSQYLSSHRTEARSYVVSAVAAGSTSDAESALEAALVMFRGLTVNLQGAVQTSGSTAHWIQQNSVPAASPDFNALLQMADELRSDVLRFSSNVAVVNAIGRLIVELAKDSPSGQELQNAANAVQNAVMAVSPPVPDLFSLVGKAHQAALKFNGLQLTESFADIRFGYEVLQSFSKGGDPASRRMSLHYFYSLLTTLTPFRRFYPFGMARTQFQHINAKEVAVLLPNGSRETESIETALYELLPGSWSYRWLDPRKSPCGTVERLGGTEAWYANLNSVEAKGAVFEPTSIVLAASDLPAEMPQLAPGQSLQILRPRVLPMALSHYRPTVDRFTALVADGDESPKISDPQAPECPTLPRAFPATWYRVSGCSQCTQVRSPEDASVGVGKHEYPAFGRSVFKEVTFSSDMRTDKFVYAIDRTYGIGAVESPRIYYRRGTPHQWVAIGDETVQTDGLTFRLNDTVISSVVQEASTSGGSLRGELIIRALRRFLLRETGADPFQADILRKLILASVLDHGKSLSTMDVTDVQLAYKSMDVGRFTSIRNDLIDGLVAGTTGIERIRLQSRYIEWYDRAYQTFATAPQAGSRFDASFVLETARDILVHSLAVVLESAMSSLVGASNGEIGYFYSPSKREVYLFDTVDGGNGYSETARRFLHIPPLQRLLHSRSNIRLSLPDVDGFQLIEEAMGDCPGQLTTRVIFDAARQGITNVASLTFHSSVSADLQARVRHEFEGVSGSATVMRALTSSQPTLFAAWQDLVWIQVLPERFVPSLVQAKVVTGIEDLKTRTHLCMTGCMECVDNADQSVHGALASIEKVSRGLLDLLRQHIIQSERSSYLDIPAGHSIGAALQGNAGQPVVDAVGMPVTVQIDDQGTPRHILLTKVLSAVSSAHSVTSGATSIRQVNVGQFEVAIPFVAAYRDERPLT
jgi:hypothetical protein